MSDKIYLFTTSRCPACPAAKQFVTDNELEDKVEQVLVDQSVDGMALAESFNVATVPTFIVQLEGDTLKLNLEEFKRQWSHGFR